MLILKKKLKWVIAKRRLCGLLYVRFLLVINNIPKVHKVAMELKEQIKRAPLIKSINVLIAAK